MSFCPRARTRHRPKAKFHHALAETKNNDRIELWNDWISVIHKIKKELTENRPIEQGSRLQVQNDNRIQEVVTKVNSLIANQKK